MSFEPILFDSTMHETANEAVLFCRGILQKNGYGDAAAIIDGLPPVTDQFSAGLTFKVLADIVGPNVEGVAREYVSIAINAVERAMVEPFRPAA